ncbi:hypothetical protein ACQ4PT_069820 [Festuca glaucescens]
MSTANCMYLSDVSRKLSTEKEIWTPPNEGSVKVNVDAAFSPMSGTAAIGAVARNDQGVVVAALSAPISACNDVEEAEARAILEGLQMASDLKLKYVTLESDSALAVAASNDTTRNHSQHWSVYKDIGLAKSLISSCSISYTRRKLNTLAHDLAKRASVSGDYGRWLDPVPEDIAILAKRDLVNIVYD